jgi:hypothetical protein
MLTSELAQENLDKLKVKLVLATADEIDDNAG